jgi:MFS family permease
MYELHVKHTLTSYIDMLGDILGRPRQILLGSTIIGIGAIIQTCSWTVASMMVGRIVAGLGTGMNTATAGVWQAETSKMNSRGKLVIIQMGMQIPESASYTQLTYL